MDLIDAYYMVAQDMKFQAEHQLAAAERLFMCAYRMSEERMCDKPLGDATRAATSRDLGSTEDAGSPPPFICQCINGAPNPTQCRVHFPTTFAGQTGDNYEP